MDLMLSISMLSRDAVAKVGRVKRRVFIAIDLPVEQKHEVLEAIRGFEWLPIRWLVPENWHITLIPPVYLEEAELKHLIQRLKAEALGQPFTVRFSRIILAPEGVEARMIWLDGPTPQEFLVLKRKIEEAIASDPKLPQPKRETRPAHLHVTLARFEPGALRDLEARTRVLAEASFVSRIDGVSIMESHLKMTGAEYETLARISLG